MKITKRANRWYDENNNSWETKQLATLYSPILTNCSYCINCRYCNDCSYCDDCSHCTRCSSCSDCSYCSHCRDCRDCNNCINCSNCSNCSYCSYCANCNSCSNISSENDKSWFKSMYYGDEVNKEIRSELDINNRKLDLDL